MGYGAKILADSISPDGFRLTTFEVCFPRVVLAEFNTHRVFSRSSASSRAIPVKKMLERVRDNPFVPDYWGKNQRGMQASEEISSEDRDKAIFTWRELRNHARKTAWYLASTAEEGGLDVHKQIANRLIEPWLWHPIIVSATEWSNFFNLRDNGKAAPEIRKPAGMMHELYKSSQPDAVNYGDWHLPLIPKDEAFNIDVEHGQAAITAAKICAGKCARASYLTHDGRRDHAEDIRLHDDILKAGHMAPLEHPARPMTREELKTFAQDEVEWDPVRARSIGLQTAWVKTGRRTHFLGNFQGWVQYRKMIPGETDIHSYRGTTA
jgi:hypothetical protein